MKVMKKKGNKMKKVKIVIILLAVFLIPNYVLASDDGSVIVNTEGTLIDCLQTSGICKLGSDIQISNILDVKKEVILDLNGQSITPSSDLKVNGGFITVARGGKLTINDSKGTGKISTGAKTNSNVWGGIQLANDDLDSTKTSELVVNGGTIEGYYYGITGYGKYHNTKITINGGNIVGLNDEDSLGIYHPQEGILTVNNGTISGGTGIEMRAGTLNIINGTIKATAPKFVKVAAKDGSTTNGVGVAVAQHTTKKAIDVTISGGDISGQYAFYEWNPHKNGTEDINKISLKITGGNFVGTADGVSTVYSEDFKNFISGGKFNKSVDDYLTESAKGTSKIEEKSADIQTKSSTGIITWISLLSILAVTGVGLYVYNKKFC